MSTQFITINGKNNNQVFTQPGKYVVFFSNISGTISCKIKSEKVEVYLIGLYDMKGKEKYNIHTEQIHIAPHSFSDLFVLSIAQNTSSLAFSGLIRIEKDAQHSHAYQKNQNLMLSNDAFVDSRPILEILANDVFCTHGSTSGPISTEQLSYLQMRGLTLDESKKISIEGFKQQVYDKLSSLGITNYDRR